MLSPKIARALSLLAAAAVVPLLALYALLIKMAMPSPDGGMEPTVAMVCYFAFTLMIGALVVIALNFSMQLGREAKAIRQTP
jgi:hypothetical protein